MMLWLESLLSQATVERFGWMLAHFLWQATAVGLLLAILLRLLRRSSANLRYLTACSALVLMVVLPAATIGLIQVTGPAAEAGPRPAASSAIAPSAQTQVVDGISPSALPMDSIHSGNPALAVPWNERVAAALRPALPYGVLGWLAGVFGLSAWHLGGWMQLQRLKRRMVYGVGTALQQRLVQIAERLGVRRAVTLLESALVEVPTVVGWLRPVILLPASALAGLSLDQLEAILAHELAHIRRYDYLVNVVQTVVEILGFYHPAVWWVSHRIRIERENCCDDVAVHLCGDSVRYARALTSLEEIRHSQAELAMAATGGSLLNRIARLLGQPVADDRRFTWMPGLIALLLVAGVLIPAALTLAGPDPRLPGSPADNAAVLMDQTPEETKPDEPSRTQVLIDYTLVEVFADRVLDPQTMADARDLLVRRPPDNVYRVIGSLAQLTLEELQRPLGDILRDSMVARDKDTELVDLLVSRGYAHATSKSTLLVLAEKQASIAIGAAQDTNASDLPQGSASMKLDTTVHLADDPNTLVVETRLVLKYPATDSGDPNRQTTTREISSMGALRNGGSLAIIERSTAQQEDKDARKRLHILLVQPTVIYRPEAASSGTAEESAASDAKEPQARVRTETADEPNGEEQEKTQVSIQVTIAAVAEGKRLDAKTVSQAEQILGERVRPLNKGGRFRRQESVTVGEILHKHVVWRCLSQETVQALSELFTSKKYMTILANPRVMTRDGEQAQIWIGTKRPVPLEAPGDDDASRREFKMVDAGTKLNVTPHVGDHNNITVNLTAEVTDVLARPGDSDLPIIRARTADQMFTISSGQYFVSAMATNATETVGKEESLYVMVMPSIVPLPDVNQAPASDKGRSNSADKTERREESAIEVKTRVAPTTDR